jgi:hypothetical protein
MNDHLERAARRVVPSRVTLSRSPFVHPLFAVADMCARRESARLLRPRRWALFTFFSLEDLAERNRLGGRWTFRHSQGPAFIESRGEPEAAVACSNDWITAEAGASGFDQADVILNDAHQSTLRCRRGTGEQAFARAERIGA